MITPRYACPCTTGSKGVAVNNSLSGTTRSWVAVLPREGPGTLSAGGWEGIGASVNGKECLFPIGIRSNHFGNLIQNTYLTKSAVNIYIGFERFSPLDSPRQQLTLAVHSVGGSGFMIDTFFPFAILV